MTDLVPADQIEEIVGARRHALAHLGRAVSAEQTVYVLHSQQCKDSGIDLRSCIYSQALDDGINGLHEWVGQEDRVVTLQVAHGCLIPDDDGPDDIEPVNYPSGDPGEFSERCDPAHVHEGQCGQDEIGDWWHLTTPSGEGGGDHG